MILYLVATIVAFLAGGIAKQYGFELIPIFILARDNVHVGDDPAGVTFEREGVYTDQTTDKPVAATTR